MRPLEFWRQAEIWALPGGSKRRSGWNPHAPFFLGGFSIGLLSFRSVAGPGFQSERHSDFEAAPTKCLAPSVKHGVDEARIEAALECPLGNNQAAFAEPALGLLRRTHTFVKG